MNDVDVSVIIAHLNSFNPLEYTMDAQIHALEYSGLKYEIIIVDNGSDATKLLQLRLWIEHMNQDNIYLFEEKVPGTVFPYQLGAERAKGKYLCFCDHHIFIPHDFYEKALKHFEDDTVGTVYPSVSFYGKHSERNHQYVFNEVTLHTKFDANIITDRVHEVATAQLIVPVIRADLFKQMGMFNKNAFLHSGGYTAEETMFGIKTWMFGKRAILDPFNYCLHGNMINEPEATGIRRKADSFTTLVYILMGEEKAKESFAYWKQTQFRSEYETFEEFLSENKDVILPEYTYIQENTVYSYKEVRKLWEEKGVPH